MKPPTEPLRPTGHASLGPPLLVDTHVHIHECFDIGEFFDAAAGNLSRAVRDRATRGSAGGVLLLTEVQGSSAFESLRNPSSAIRDQLRDWQISTTPDPRALLCEKRASLPLLIIAGRQIRTREALEVLALGCLETIEDGLEIDEALRRSRQWGALPVIPWGFGKWTASRGQKVRDLITQQATETFCLGDIGGRWRGLSEPSLLAEGREHGYTILPGSDPLPFAREVHRVGSSGIELSIGSRLEDATRDLLARLRRLTPEDRVFLQLESLGPFVRHQLLMQTRRFWP